MAREKPPYRKLTGVYRSIGAMNQLWLGADHLLHVSSTGYTENYRRLYLRDIQAILLVHTARRLYLHLALGVIAGIFVLIFVFARVGEVGYAVLGGLLLPFILWNQLLGAGCRVVFVTAVQQENVQALSRTPRSRRVLAELAGLINAAQADLAAAVPAVPAVVDSGPALPPTLPPFLPT